jgi:uncharacterized membrane protein YfbV (UPF0208 family)
MQAIMPNRLAPAFLAALLTFPGAVLAQSTQSAPPQAATPSPPVASTSPMAGRPAAGKTAAERVEQRIKQLHTQLRITAAEEPQWNQFADVMRQNARDMDQAFLNRAQQFETMNAVQNMQSYEQLADQHAQHVQKLVVAFENLYGAMPEQQKQLADQVFRANAQQHDQRRGRSG